ncbi:MAG: ROK family protein, partial [Oscillospiraceae bacterium]
SKPTISSSVAELEQREILKEIGVTVTEVGKRPMLYDVNYDIKYVMALDFISYITKNIVAIAVCNLAFEIIFTDTIKLYENYSADYLMEELPDILLNTLQKNKVSLEKIEAVVITAPTALYNQESVKFSCKTGESVNLVPIIKQTFNKKIIVKNDINLAALGEKFFGVGKQSQNLIFIWAGLAVGGGIILDGKIYEGFSSGGGEIAYNTVFDEISQEYVFLKDVLSMQGIRKYISYYEEEAKKSQIAEKLFSNKLTLDDIITAAHEKDAFCNSFGKYVATKVSAIISNLSSTIDLQMAIVGGEYSRFGHVFIDEIINRIELLPITNTQVTTPMYSNSAMYGAFKVGTDYVIRNLI